MFLKILNTLGPIGFLPASGSWSSFITLFIAYICGFFYLSTFYQIIIISFLGMIAFYAIHTTRISFGRRKDPKEIVLDEVLGMLITVIGLPATLPYIIGSFTLFRIFDIYKPWPIFLLEKLPDAWGILLDDCAAGICACLVLQTIYYYF